jgi:hypothetical protein
MRQGESRTPQPLELGSWSSPPFGGKYRQIPLRPVDHTGLRHQAQPRRPFGRPKTLPKNRPKCGGREVNSPINFLRKFAFLDGTQGKDGLWEGREAAEQPVRSELHHWRFAVAEIDRDDRHPGGTRHQHISG